MTTKHGKTRLRTDRRPADNSTLAIGGVSSPLDSFVVAKVQFSELTFVLEILPIANLQNVCDLNQLLMKQVIECYLTDGRN
jgi:hypothetical protein